MVVGLFVVIWVARYLGPEQFGLFSYAQSFVGLFLAISGLGLDGIVVRELVRDESRRDVLLGTAFVLRLVGAIAVLALLGVAVLFMKNDTLTNALVFIIASSTVFQSFNVIDFYFQSRVLSRYVVYANVTMLFLSSLLKIALILYKAPLIAFAWVVLFDSFVLALGFIYFYNKHSNIGFLKWRFDIKIAISLLKDSWPLLMSGMVVSIYMKIDQVMIQEMINSEAVGQYAAAVRISEAWYFVPGAIATSVFPAIMNAKKVSRKLYYDRLQRLYDLVVWLAIMIAFPMTFLSAWLISLLYGVAYTQAGEVLMIHIWTGVFVFLGIAGGGWLTAENLTRKFLHKSLLGVSANITLNLILIPISGIYGAAMATLFSQMIANYGYDLLDKDLRVQFKMKSRAFLPLHIFRSYV